MSNSTIRNNSFPQMERQEQNVSASVPVVSIVTPTYNAADYIAATIASVNAQTFQDWEHIIVDDASSDDTVGLLQEYAAKDPRIRVIALEKNGGAAVARNTGIDSAKGRYIAFLDADDMWLPNKLTVQINYMLTTGAKFTYTSYQVVDEDGNERRIVAVPPRVSYREVLRNNMIGCLTAVYDTEYFGRVHMPLIRKRQDLGLWLLLLKQVRYAEGLKEVLGQYRLRAGSLSHSKASAAKFTWKLYREVEKLPLPVAIYCYMFYALSGFAKTYLRPRRRK